MFFNATYYSIILHSSLSPSPLFSLTSPTIFSLKNSQFSKIFHPIIHKKYMPHSILFENVLASQLFCSFQCESLPESPDGATKTGCLSNVGTKFMFTNDNSYDLLNADISLISCTFIDCTTHQMSPIFIIQSSSVVMKNLIVRNCKYTFGQISAPFNHSKVQFSTFENCFNPFTISEGDFLFESSNFYISNSENNNNVNLQMCTTISFYNCTFRMNGDIFAITAEQTPDIRITSCNFLSDSKIEIKDGSYLMLVSTCFEHSESQSIINSDYSVKTDVRFNYNCRLSPTPVNQKQKRNPYAIATITVFTVCFAILFIALSILFFCKIGRNDVTQFGQLHEGSQGDDEVSSVELDD